MVGNEEQRPASQSSQKFNLRCVGIPVTIIKYLRNLDRWNCILVEPRKIGLRSWGCNIGSDWSILDWDHTLDLTEEIRKW